MCSIATALPTEQGGIVKPANSGAIKTIDSLTTYNLSLLLISLLENQWVKEIVIYYSNFIDL